MTLFLDANVIFAAAITPKGRTQALIDLAGAGLCKLLTSQYALDEVSRNVQVKFPESQERLTALIQQLSVGAEPNDDVSAWATQRLPAKDAPLLS